MEEEINEEKATDGPAHVGKDVDRDNRLAFLNEFAQQRVGK